MKITVLAIPVALLAASGCATTATGPGAIDDRLAAAARSPTAKEVEFVLGPGSRFLKVAVEDNATDAVPEALRKLAESTYPGGKISEYEREVYEDGALVHEIEVKTVDGKECEISASEAGALRYTECKLKPEEAPEAARKALEAAAPGATVDEVEIRKSADGSEEIRYEVKSGARKLYFRFKPDGTLIAKAAILEAEFLVPLP